MNTPIATQAARSVLASHLTPGEKAGVLCEIYQKHAGELLAIEEAQQKLTLLLLGVFGAGTSLLVSARPPAFSALDKVAVTLVVVAILAVGWRYTLRRDHARQTVRELVVECEKALGVFDLGLYRPDSTLYPLGLERFPLQGYWLSYTFWIGALAAAGFIIVLFAR